MNKVILMGRLTADPELRQTPNGIAMCRFTVAVNRKFKDKNSGETKADFISCQAWRQTAEFVSKYFHKGNMIALEGTLQTGSYKDRNYPDVTHYTTDVIVDNVEFTGSKSEAGTSSQSTQNYQVPQPQTATAPATNDSLSYGSLSEFEEILSDGDVPF